MKRDIGIKIWGFCFMIVLCLSGCGEKNDVEGDSIAEENIVDNKAEENVANNETEEKVVDYKYADCFEDIKKVMEFTVNGKTYQMGLKPEEYDFTNYVGGITDGINVASDNGDIAYRASLHCDYNLLEQIEVFVLSDEEEIWDKNYDEDFEFCGIHIGDPIEKADIFGEPALENYHQGGDIYEKMYYVYGENTYNTNQVTFHYMYDENEESHIYQIDLYSGLCRIVKEIP